MEDESNSTDTTDAFLSGLGDRLSANEGVDVELANILKLHILKSDPAQGAVVQAKAAILELAVARATPPMLEEPDD